MHRTEQKGYVEGRGAPFLGGGSFDPQVGHFMKRLAAGSKRQLSDGEQPLGVHVAGAVPDDSLGLSFFFADLYESDR